MTTIERPSTSPDAESTKFNVVGTRPPRPDGVEKVTGQAIYSADYQPAGTIPGLILRSPHAHARILSIDTSRAEAVPGVRAVVTAKDMPPASSGVADMTEGAMMNLGFLSQNFLATTKALYRGHAIAAVAADDRFVAAKALSLIDVQYEVLPPVLNGLEAIDPDSPIVLEGLKTAEVLGGPVGTGEGPDSNIAMRFVVELGDPGTGFAAADAILERRYKIGAAHQSYIEPQTTTASWGSDGHLTIWCSSQGHFNYRDVTAMALGMSSGDITVVQLEIGGGFGAKLFPAFEPIAALLSKKAGKPVRLKLSRSDIYESVGGTSASVIDLKMGMTRDGVITAASARLVFEAGAFPGSPVGGCARSMFAMYDIPNAFIEGLDVIVNKPKSTAYRGPGAPSGSFAVESMLDEFCLMFDLDPMAVRLRNAAVEGTRRIDGTAMPSLGFVEVVEAARATDHWKTPWEGPNRGRGIAAGYWGNAPGIAAMTGTVLPDGIVGMVEGSPDIGGSRATAAMMLAEALEIPVAQVRPKIGDTDSIGFTSLTGGSSTTHKQGVVAKLCAEDIKDQMRARAATVWNAPLDDVSYAAGIFTLLGDPEKTMTFKQVAALANVSGGPVVGSATVTAGGQAPGTALNIADVEVDPETGKTTVVRYTTICDVGRAIHPSYVEGQLQGAAAQGIGWAINEEYVYGPDGRMQNSTLLDYRIPTTLDLPMIEPVIVEKPNPLHPFGVRGVGETGIIPPLGAIGNAVSRALNYRFETIPLTPTRVVEHLIEREEPTLGA